jgi:hypothetical protein
MKIKKYLRQVNNHGFTDIQIIENSASQLSTALGTRKSAKYLQKRVAILNGMAGERLRLMQNTTTRDKGSFYESGKSQLALFLRKGDRSVFFSRIDCKSPLP